jgi:EAL domain-containing protein (putative c-di-GMP-specific phosphodiesterase class I)
MNKYDDAIVEAIIIMTKKMGMEVLAEGVENPEQVDFLQKNHGSQLQGYYYSSPLEAAKCSELLHKQKFLALKSK